jgi:hypothetical protein
VARRVMPASSVIGRPKFTRVRKSNTWRRAVISALDWLHRLSVCPSLNSGERRLAKIIAITASNPEVATGRRIE